MSPHPSLHTAPPADSAKAAKLRYVRRSGEGIARVGRPKSFRYRFGGRYVKDQETLLRIRKLAIPPAWTNVWICPDANGHLQATGYDIKGRKQYRYHTEWSAFRSLTKYAHAQRFGAQLPAMRKRIERDLKLHGLPAQKVLAAVVSIMDHTQIRMGNDAYARENGSFGLSTLLDRHVQKDGACVRFVFKGKTGVSHNIRLNSAHLSRLVMRCKELPGQDLFQYVDEAGEARAIDSGMVNDYIRSITDGRFTSKDIRTWKGTVHCVRALLRQEPAGSLTQMKERVNSALDEVARALGNTRTVCRKYYVHPRVIEAFETGALHATKSGTRTVRSLSQEERLLLDLLSEKPVRSIGRSKPRPRKAA